jgi:hypothetical protein
MNADVPDIQTIIVSNDEPTLNPLGAKGLGELPMVGAPIMPWHPVARSCVCPPNIVAATLDGSPVAFENSLTSLPDLCRAFTSSCCRATRHTHL